MPAGKKLGCGADRVLRHSLVRRNMCCKRGAGRSLIETTREIVCSPCVCASSMASPALSVMWCVCVWSCVRDREAERVGGETERLKSKRESTT